jgi:hypothetical protein
MKLLLAGALAAVTVAGLAAIRPALLTEQETAAASAIRENRMRADARFLSSDGLGEPGLASRGDRVHFVAAADEEQGRSALLAHQPQVPAARVAATLDIDGSRVRSRTHAVPVVVLGPSSLEEWVRAIAQAQGRAVVPDLAAGWDSSGGVEDARLLFLLGAKVAEAPLTPSWRPGEVESARLKALAELGR